MAPITEGRAPAAAAAPGSAGGRAWQLGWWAPLAPSAAPDELLDPTTHGPLLAAAAAGSPLDAPGRHRLAALKSAGLCRPDGRPRFPVAPAEPAARVDQVAADVGASVARLLAGGWSRIEVEYEPLRRTVTGSTGPVAAFLVVGGLLLDLGVRRLLRVEGLSAPSFGSAFVWLAEGGQGVAGTWFARVTPLPGRGRLVRFGRPDLPAWDAAAADPDAAPAVPAAREPELLELVEALGWPIVHAVEDAMARWDPFRRRVPGGEDEGAFLAWAYSLVVSHAIAALGARGLLEAPPGGVVSVRVSDRALAGA